MFLVMVKSRTYLYSLHFTRKFRSLQRSIRLHLVFEGRMLYNFGNPHKAWGNNCSLCSYCISIGGSFRLNYVLYDDTIHVQNTVYLLVMHIMHQTQSHCNTHAASHHIYNTHCASIMLMIVNKVTKGLLYRQIEII